MNKELRHKLITNQQKNAEDFIDWFKNINENQL